VTVAGLPLTRDPAREAAVVAAYTASEEETYKTVGERIGLSRERVRQLVVAFEQRTGSSVQRAPERRCIARACRSKPSPPTLAQKIAARVRVDPETGCWEWGGSYHPAPGGQGFPRFEALGEQLARRVSYRLWCGPIPSGRVVTTTCGNERCVSPFDLAALDPSAARRLAREMGRTRKHTPRTHCLRGHEFTPENTAWNPGWEVRDGVRVRIRTRLCKTCLRERNRSYARLKPATSGRPPLPPDPHEAEVERIIRRATRASLADRLRVLQQQLEPWVIGAPLPVAVREHESFAAYQARVPQDSTWLYTWWIVGRVLADHRIKALMERSALNGGGPQ
jgi:hypothetical protein